MKLSIIVPVYNVQDYLKNTLDSFLNQDLEKKDYEILVVNDGSTDNSLKVAEDFKNKNKNYNVVLIDKPNGGVSSARNIGLKKAKGDFVMFVDGDDQLIPNSIKSVLDYSFKNDLDICNCRFENDIINQSIYVSSYGLSPKENYFRGRDQTIDSSCTHLFKRHFLIEHNLEYNEKMRFLEDGEFLIRAYYFSEKVASVDAFIYKRIIRQGSATKSNINVSTEVLYGYISAINSLKELLKLNERSENNVILEQGIVKYFIHFYSVVLFKLKFTEFTYNFINNLLDKPKLNNFRLYEFYPSDYKYYAKYMKMGLMSISLYLFFQKTKSFLKLKIIK